MEVYLASNIVYIVPVYCVSTDLCQSNFEHSIIDLMKATLLPDLRHSLIASFVKVFHDFSFVFKVLQIST